MNDVEPSEITPEHVYRNRRAFMRRVGGMGTLAAVAAVAGAAALSACSGAVGPSSPIWPAPEPEVPPDTQTPYNAITNYNNYYEFSTAKEEVAGLARKFALEPWAVAVGGMVHKPRTFAIQEILEQFPSEERIYRLRCVEGWSMVIPWLGFPLRQLLEQVEPTAEAKYVRFETVKRPEAMPGQRVPFYPWPYVEGLRLDEAMHDLTILVTGLYGKTLPPQNGAPLRLIVPWKYGFKSVKAIVKIDLVAQQPKTLWMAVGPDEYGFYANVNPDVPHPRWSQSTERRIGEVRRRRTLPFNGYADWVSHLYEGMDLRKNF